MTVITYWMYCFRVVFNKYGVIKRNHKSFKFVTTIQKCCNTQVSYYNVIVQFQDDSEKTIKSIKL